MKSPGWQLVQVGGRTIYHGRWLPATRWVDRPLLVVVQLDEPQRDGSWHWALQGPEMTAHGNLREQAGGVCLTWQQARHAADLAAEAHQAPARP